MINSPILLYDRLLGLRDKSGVTYNQSVSLSQYTAFQKNISVACIHIGEGARPTLGESILLENICVKNSQNARLLHPLFPKNIFPIWGGVGNMPPAHPVLSAYACIYERLQGDGNNKK